MRDENPSSNGFDRADMVDSADALIMALASEKLDKQPIWERIQHLKRCISYWEGEGKNHPSAEKHLIEGKDKLEKLLVKQQDMHDRRIKASKRTQTKLTGKKFQFKVNRRTGIARRVS